MSNYNVAEIKQELASLFNPFANKTLGSADAIKHVGIDKEKDVVVLIINTYTNNPEEVKYLRKAIAKLIKIDLGFSGIKIQFEQAKEISCKDAKFILIESGKGGVGKSQIAINLAYHLALLGKKVGLIDGDIYTPAANIMLMIPNQTLAVNDYGKIIPHKIKGFEMVSVEFFNQPDEAVLWNKDIVNNMFSNFLYQVAWNKDLEYVIVDMPSLTTEFMVNVKTILPDSEVLLVTSPSFTSAHSVIKAGNGLKQLGQSIIGVIENMNGFPVSKDEDEYLNTNGGKVVSNALDIELICSITFKPAKTGYLYELDEENGQIFKDLATLISIR